MPVVALNMPSYMTRYPIVIETGKNYLARTMLLVKATGVHTRGSLVPRRSAASSYPALLYIFWMYLSFTSVQQFNFFIDSGKVRLSWTS